MGKTKKVVAENPNFVATKVNDKQWWVRLPNDAGWFRLSPLIGPWWTFNENEAVAKADELNLKMGIS
jgi:hypothetical protein